MGATADAAKRRAIAYQVAQAGLNPDDIDQALVTAGLATGTAQQVARREIERLREGVTQ